jgi:hypothetical protein
LLTAAAVTILIIWYSHSLAEETKPLLLVGKLGLPNLVSSQNDIQRALHLAEQTLIRRRGAALKVRNDGGCGVALLSQILLCHGRPLVVLRLGPRLGNGLADDGADGLGLHNVVGSVNLGQALAFRRAAADLCLN